MPGHMSELRKDPIVGRWVIISTERAKRPTDFKPRAAAAKPGLCPFCPGQEDKTPPEILAYRDNGSPANSPGWRVRVVPNRFPALSIEGKLDRKGEGMFDRMNGVGAHVTELDDGLAFEPADPAALHGAAWNSYADHRMATTGALIGLAIRGVELDDIGTTAKTLPEFPELWAAMLHDPAATSWIEL